MIRVAFGMIERVVRMTYHQYSVRRRRSRCLATISPIGRRPHAMWA